ncbi:hypothetical protein RFI_35540 [Reticulomyxa filosa]|uniref:Endonuclease/exonuclease/phosphatase domain-containing protein n=1 Tax=Reticulomyxa filosa TaxID=46433 RepID=X6LJZ0_RETFI|nr:hypothetical protein RFI_35540 [Reticulomyxa filosa]|eukprot:ETO01899.1 hypothetical protein RFI_35540 [Reticulomyxa filosa]
MKSQTSILKIFGKNGKSLSTKVKAHTFSSIGKQCLHFHETVQYQEFDKIAKNFNDMKISIEEKENKGENIETKAQEITNPETNRCVLLKNVSTRETEKEIIETLQEMEYDVEKVIADHKSDIFEHRKCKKGIERRLLVLDITWQSVSTMINIEIVQDHTSISARIALESIISPKIVSRKESAKNEMYFVQRQSCDRLHFMSYHPENNAKDWTKTRTEPDERTNPTEQSTRRNHSNEETTYLPVSITSALKSFEKEVTEARKVTEHIVIGGDWNAHNPAWLDDNFDDIGEHVVDFIVNNNLHI